MYSTAADQHPLMDAPLQPSTSSPHAPVSGFHEDVEQIPFSRAGPTAAYKRVSSDEVSSSLLGLRMLAVRLAEEWTVVYKYHESLVENGSLTGMNVPLRCIEGAEYIVISRNDDEQQSSEIHLFTSRSSSTFLHTVDPGSSSNPVSGCSLVQKQGSWRAVVEKVKQSGGAAMNPDVQLAFSAYHILGLLKLRMFGAAADELKLIGDLNDAKYRFESHPTIFPGKKGTSSSSSSSSSVTELTTTNRTDEIR